jgi:hypothetical protein
MLTRTHLHDVSSYVHAPASRDLLRPVPGLSCRVEDEALSGYLQFAQDILLIKKYGCIEGRLQGNFSSHRTFRILLSGEEQACILTGLGLLGSN